MVESDNVSGRPGGAGRKRRRARRRRPIDPSDCAVEFIVTMPMADPEPSAYVTEVDGRIVVEEPPRLPAHGEDDGVEAVPDQWVPRRVGRIALSVYHLDRAELDGVRPFEVFDCVSQAALDLYQDIYDKRGEFRRELAALVARHGVTGTSLLVIEAVELLPRFRGCGLGLAAALKAMHLFGPEGGLAALVAAPMEAPFRRGGAPEAEERLKWRRRMRMDAFPQREPEPASHTLAEYWSRLGFKHLRPGESRLCVRGLGVRLPSVEDVLGRPAKGV